MSWVRNGLTAKNLIEDAQARNPQIKIVVSDSPYHDAALQYTGKHVTKVYYNRKLRGNKHPQAIDSQNLMFLGPFFGASQNCFSPLKGDGNIKN